MTVINMVRRLNSRQMMINKKMNGQIMLPPLNTNHSVSIGMMNAMAAASSISLVESSSFTLLIQKRKTDMAMRAPLNRTEGKVVSLNIRNCTTRLRTLPAAKIRPMYRYTLV